MCDPVSAGMFAIQAVGQVGQHNAQRKAVGRANREKLKQFDIANQNYLTQVMMDNNKWKNDVIVSEIEQDQVFDAMVNQWEDYDEQLDSLFADADFKLQDAVIKMYQSDYAGEQTGRTAGRRAAEGARKLGFYKAEQTAKLMLSQSEADVKKEGARLSAMDKTNELYEKIRFPPIPGHTPVPPTLAAKPSSASLILGLAGSALQAYGMHKLANPSGTGMKPIESGYSGGDAVKFGRDVGQSLNIDQGGATFVDISGDKITETLISPSQMNDPSFDITQNRNPF